MSEVIWLSERCAVRASLSAGMHELIHMWYAVSCYTWAQRGERQRESMAERERERERLTERETNRERELCSQRGPKIFLFDM